MPSTPRAGLDARPSVPDPGFGAAWHQRGFGDADFFEGVSQMIKLACFQAVGNAGLAVEGFGAFNHRLWIVLHPDQA